VVVTPVASDPTAMCCGEKMSGMEVLMQVKAGHWKVEVLEAETTAAGLEGTPQRRFKFKSLSREGEQDA
jgi:hypothetical protein